MKSKVPISFCKKPSAIRLSAIYVPIIFCFLSCEAGTNGNAKTDSSIESGSKDKLKTEEAKKSNEKTTIAEDVYFDFKIIKGAKNQDERVGTDAEIEVFFMVNDRSIDTYNEFGLPELNDTKKELYVYSEMIEKTFTIRADHNNKIHVTRQTFCSDFDIQEVETEWVYAINSSGQRKLSSCTGDCD